MFDVLRQNEAEKLENTLKLLLKTGQLKSSHARNIEIDYDNYYEITDKLLCYLIERLFT